MELEHNKYYIKIQEMLEISLDDISIDESFEYIDNNGFDDNLKAELNYYLWRCTPDISFRYKIEYESLMLSEIDEKGLIFLDFPKKYVSDETREKNKLAQYQRTPETQQKMANANRGKKRSEETRRKMSISRKGKTPWNKGISPSDETKQKLREANLGKKQTESTKRKRAESISKLKWYNNGVKNIRAEKCPEGFTEGRLHFKLSEKGKNNSSHKGMHWFTNDLDNIMAFECPVGYHPGKCKKKEQN